MEHRRIAVRLGAAAVLLAITLRLAGGGFFAPLGRLLEEELFYSVLLYLQTGRVVRLPAREAGEPPGQEAPQQQPQALSFSPEEAAGLQIHYGCHYRPETRQLLLQPLHWQLRQPTPTVLILHSHATESYTQTPDTCYEEDAAYRTLDSRYNMLAIGREVARVLTEGGIRVIHDTRLHDYPSYPAAYGNSRAAVEEYLRQYPGLLLVLDLHRDASDAADGSQLTTAATVGGQPAAQLMVVAGTDAGGGYHPNWQENLALGLKLTALLERTDPGITRPVDLRSGRFNMDLCPGSLLIEVGAAGNTQQEALLAANALARAILALAEGTRQE